MDQDDYFNGYAGVGIHRIMLGDRVRTQAYRDAIDAVIEPGMLVLEVGAGTGVLSMFAVQAGAARVYAVDRSGILSVTKELVEANGMSDRIELIAGLAERIRLPEKVDVIVSEWMGYFALTESMFESVVQARHRHLAPGGRMIPSAIKLFITLVENPELYMEHGFGIWQEPVYGLDYRPMLAYELGDLETYSHDGSKSRVLAAPALMADIDCERAPVRTYWFETQTEIVIEHDGSWHGLLGHFEALLAPDIVLSTAADEPLTHWRQSWFPMHAREVHAGDRILLTMRARKDPNSNGRKPQFFVYGTLERGDETLDRFSYCYFGTFE